ncbi:serine/threonine protein kinase [Bifidobacterium pullorum subsp. saeculare]|uniref:non-specific serine/threonine protein kinase n=1 Tax=Bifidobacterium pullorum subsp. saeculare TaxID=78257 RepID=A0A939B9M2_9BIFI|nr:serine/threonine protein kinase [Bifidobacterium pullorum subsp. saeculare]
MTDATTEAMMPGPAAMPDSPCSPARGVATPRPYPPTQAPSLPGMRCLGPIGSGACAVVFRYRPCLPSEPDVAVRVGRRPLSPAGRARFLASAETLERLSCHPNIVRLHRLSVLPDGRSLVVSQLAEGGSLAELMARAAPVPPGLALDIGVAMAGALAAAHRMGLVHRDVKPGNILFDAQGVPLLADFGVAGTPYDRQGLGFSPRWAAPEVLRGGAGAEQADLYALAATMLAMLGGSAPPPLDAVLRHAMMDDPDLRHATAEDLAQDLRMARDRLGWSPKPSGSPPTPSRPARSLPAAPPDDGAHRRRNRRHPWKRWVVWLAPAAVGVLLAGGLAALPHRPPTVVGPAFESPGSSLPAAGVVSYPQSPRQRCIRSPDWVSSLSERPRHARSGGSDHNAPHGFLRPDATG